MKPVAAQTWARIGHSAPHVSAQSRIRPHMTGLCPGAHSYQLRTHFAWWWQVQGSNLGRLSRRFTDRRHIQPGLRICGWLLNFAPYSPGDRSDRRLARPDQISAVASAYRGNICQAHRDRVGRRPGACEVSGTGSP